MVDAATVSVRALEGRTPFAVIASCPAGECEVREVPNGVSIEFIAKKPGWTTRRLVKYTMMGPLEPLDISFGHVSSGNGYDGGTQFISDYPEIEHIAIAPSTRNINFFDEIHDPTNAVLEIVFSETFDEPTRQRLASAVRLWPADGATGNAAAIDVSEYANLDRGDGLVSTLLGKLDFPPAGTSEATQGAIDAGAGGRARTAWSADGRTLFFIVDRTIGAADGESAYQVGLVSDGALYRAADGHSLGTDQHGFRDSVVPAGQLLANVIWNGGTRPSATTGEVPKGGLQRWNATHSATAKFKVRSAP